MRFSVPASAVVAAFVGFGGTLALVLSANEALGATPLQKASAVTAMCLALAAETLVLSLLTRMPVVTAWSTAGSALLAASQGYTVNEAVAAYLLAALALVATGLFRPLTNLIARIPSSIASGMLAGILLGFTLKAAQTVPLDPGLVIPLVLLFFVIRRFNPALSVLAVLFGGIGLAFLLGRVSEAIPELHLSAITLIRPDFTLGSAVGLALPIYLVTMASQNLSGLAVLRAAGFQPPPGLAIGVTGLGSLLSAPFGSLTTNLAAISAAICTGPDAHPDPAERWKTAPFYALCYGVFGLFGASLVAFFAILPPALIVLVAGLALLAPFTNALVLALKEEGERVAAVTTLAVTASGITVAGVGAAFWGLCAGIAVLALNGLRRA